MCLPGYRLAGFASLEVQQAHILVVLHLKLKAGDIGVVLHIMGKGRDSDGHGSFCF